MTATERPQAAGAPSRFAIARAEAVLQSASLLLARGEREAVRTLHAELCQALGQPSLAVVAPYPSQRAAEDQHRELMLGLSRERARWARVSWRQDWLRRFPQWAAWAIVACIVIGLVLRYEYAIFDRWRWQHEHPAGSWISRYYNRRNFQDFLLERYDVAINYDWGKGAPAEAMDRDHWSATWDTCLVAVADVKLSLRLVADDLGKLLVDGAVKIDVRSAGARSSNVRFPPGAHHLQVQYQEKRRGSKLQLHGIDFAGTPTYRFERPRLEGDTIHCEGVGSP